MMENGGGFAVGGIFFLLAIIIGLALFALWLWALIDAIKNPALDSTMRLVWVLVILFANLLGALIYLAVGRNSGPGNPGAGPSP